MDKGPPNKPDAGDGLQPRLIRDVDTMPKKGSLRARLRKAGIRSYDVLIHDQPKEWLIRNFKQGATDYPVNVARLMRNIVWQTKERIQSGEKPPLKELLRTFWYMYIKPTLSRADSLGPDVDQYKYLIKQFVYMIKEIEVMKYKDIGFRDDGQAHRKVGANANIVLFSEKLGHQDFLSDIADKYNVSILALGGQPSVLTSEYFVDVIRNRGINLQRSFYLFSIVDYDPSGWIIRDAFIDNLKFYGIPHTRVVDLIHPDMLTPEEIELARVRIKTPEEMRVKNKAWLKAVHKKNYRNQKYLEETKRGPSTSLRTGKKILYGLQSEAISAKRLEGKLTQVMVPLLGKSEDLLKTFELKELDKAIKELIIHKVA